MEQMRSDTPTERSLREQEPAVTVVCTTPCHRRQASHQLIFIDATMDASRDSVWGVAIGTIPTTAIYQILNTIAPRALCPRTDPDDTDSISLVGTEYHFEGDL